MPDSSPQGNRDWFLTRMDAFLRSDGGHVLDYIDWALGSDGQAGRNFPNHLAEVRSRPVHVHGHAHPPRLPVHGLTILRTCVHDHLCA
jgi:hypothetical protein